MSDNFVLKSNFKIVTNMKVANLLINLLPSSDFTSLLEAVMAAYFLSRKIIFKLASKDGSYKEFFNFIFTNLINLIIPLFIWYLIDIYRPTIQENELQFLVATVLIHSSILPIKYLVYKFFVFKDSLES